MLTQSLRHQNTVLDTVHLNMIFEDASILKSNSLIRKSLRQISTRTNTLRRANISRGAFSKFREYLKELVRTSENQGGYAAFEVNIAKCALFCINKMYEAYEPIIKKQKSDVKINLLVQEEVIRNGWKLRQNSDDSNLDYNTWLVDTDGLIFNTNKNTNQQISSDSDLQTLNSARSVSVNPLRKFFNLSSEKITSEHRIQDNAYPLLYAGQHPSRFRSKGKHDDPEIHVRMCQMWQKSEERRKRIFRNGTDHHIIFLHPNSEILEYTTNENIREEIYERIYEGNGCKPNSVVQEQVGCSLLFSKPTAKTPFFDPRTEDHVIVASVKAAISLASPKNGLKFSSQLTRDTFFSCYLPKERYNLQEWKESCLQSALYFKKYQPIGQNGQIQAKRFPWDQKRQEIMTNDDIQALLSTFKYTVRCVKNNESGETNRQAVWNRPHRCNGVTTIRIDSIPENERLRVKSNYGSGYGGFKPCERIVHKDMRCRVHRQQGPRTPTEFYDFWPS